MREFENEWYIRQILDYYKNTIISGVYPDYEWIEQRNFCTVCARAIELTCERNGFVMPLDMFFEWTALGALTDYDGYGYYCDINGEAIANVDFVTATYPEDTVYVAWYNK